MFGSSKEVKEIDFVSGSKLVREINGETEEWKFKSISLAMSTFMISFEGSENIQMLNLKKEESSDSESDEESEGELDEEIHIKVKPLAHRTMFTLKKTKPFKLKFRFNMKEDPIPIEEQKKYLEDERNKTRDLIKNSFSKLMQIPYEVSSDKTVKKVLKKNNMDHFVDPLFPPDDSSIYCRQIEEYPFPNVVHWRRPKDFMENPQLFLDKIEPADIKQGTVPD